MSYNQTITCDCAACILFSKEYTPSNEEECLMLIENMPKNMKICHHGDQYLPVLVPSSYLNRHRLHFYTYPFVVEPIEEILLEAEIGSSRETTFEDLFLCKRCCKSTIQFQNFNIDFLVGDHEILSFLNVVFTPDSPAKDDKRTFSFESLSLEEIYKLTRSYIGRFRNEKNNL
jgi:hypothetical protein